MQNIQKAHTTQQRIQKKNPIQKWAEDLNTGISLKKTYRCPRGTWKDAQHLQLLEECKPKLQWGTIPVRMTIIKKSTNNNCWRGCGGKGIFLPWECKLVKPLWRTVWSYLEKVKIELPYDPTIPSLGIYLGGGNTCNSKRYMHPHVRISTIYNSQDMEAT